MKKIRIIKRNGKWYIYTRGKFSCWTKYDYYFKEEDALAQYKELVLSQAKPIIIKESEWL